MISAISILKWRRLRGSEKRNGAKGTSWWEMGNDESAVLTPFTGDTIVLNREVRNL